MLFLSFGFMSQITSPSVCVCLRVCVCLCMHASVRVCRQVRQQTLTVRFHAPRAAPQTDILFLGVEEMIGLAALPGSFHKHDDFEESIVSEPLAHD